MVDDMSADNVSTDAFFQSVKTPARLEELTPLLAVLSQQENGEELIGVIEAFSEEASVSVEDFHFLPRHPFSAYCYYKDGVFLGFPTIDKAYFDMFNLAKGLKMQKKLVEKAFVTGNFSPILDLAETVSQLILFEYYYEHVKPEDKYALFMDTYIHQEYGFTWFQKDIVQDAFASQPEAVRNQAIEKLTAELSVTADDRITVYRGMGTESTPVDEAMSWTIAERTAHFFANRLGEGGYVVKGEVAVKDVIDYLTGRNESEVIVLPEHVTVLDLGFAVNTSEEMSRLKEAGAIREFHLMRDNYLPVHAFENPNGIHGVKHAKRVLLHCLSLSHAIGLPLNERGILAIAANYHDIGRKHDWACTEHGTWSVEKKSDLDLPSEYFTVNEWDEVDMDYLTMEEEEALHFIMVYHCKSDKDAEKAVEEMEDGEQKDMIQRLLPIFKDADALDRVRLGDLDPAYLRTKEARQRVRFAHDVLSFLE